MKKQTAVEWLINEISKRPNIIYNTEIDKLFAQAKAMEKEQIMDAYSEGDCHGWSLYSRRPSEHYYNQTYNTDTP